MTEETAAAVVLRGASAVLRAFGVWAPRLVWLNVLWIGGSVLGMVVLGVWPATAAMFAVTSRWCSGEPECGVFTTFRQEYQREFWRANALGGILAVAGAVLVFDLHFVAASQAPLRWAEVPLIAVGFAYAVLAVLIWPVFARYQTRLLDYFRLALVVGVCHPLRTLLMLAEVGAMVVLSTWLQGASLCVGGAMLALALTWFAQRSMPAGSPPARPHHDRPTMSRQPTQ